MMKKPAFTTTVLLSAASLALAACGGETATDETATDGMAETENSAADNGMLDGDTPGFEAVAPGEYEVVEADGTTSDLTIHPGMTWSMVFADGEAAGGTIYQQGGQTCFVTEGEEGEDCFTAGEVQEDGSMENTSSDGTTMTVRPIDVEADEAA